MGRVPGMPITSRPRTVEIDPGTPDVLIVDDDVELRESLLETLQERGFTTIAAANGAEGLQLVRERSPRLILLDLEMPVLNGWQVLERRRRDRRLAAIPVVVMSALADHRVEAFGADAQLEKPLDTERLAGTVGRLLSRDLSNQRTILVVDDDPDTRAELGALLEDAGYRVACANNGQHADTLLREIQRPYCIIVDLLMPVMNGWSFVTGLQRFGQPPIPIIVVTAAEPYWGYPVPLTHVLRKPFHSDSLLGMLGRLAASSDKQNPSHDPPLAGRARAGNGE